MPDRSTYRAPERVTVIGLGRFGTATARTLVDLGYEVTAIDMDERTVREAAEWVTLAAQGDGTDPELLKQLNVQMSDVLIVAQGANLEASVLTTLLAKKLGVKWVVAKAVTSLHSELLYRVGADRVVLPEADAGSRLAHSIGVHHMNDYISLTPTAGIAKVRASENLIGHSLQDLLAQAVGNISILLIRRGNQILSVPSYREVIQPHDELVLTGSDQDMERFIEARYEAPRSNRPMSAP